MAVATDKRKISAYVDEDILDKAQKLAKLESRSLSSLVEILLKDAIRKAEQEGRL